MAVLVFICVCGIAFLDDTFRIQKIYADSMQFFVLFFQRDFITGNSLLFNRDKLDGGGYCAQGKAEICFVDGHIIYRTAVLSGAWFSGNRGGVVFRLY